MFALYHAVSRAAESIGPSYRLDPAELADEAIADGDWPTERLRPDNVLRQVRKAALRLGSREKKRAKLLRDWCRRKTADRDRQRPSDPVELDDLKDVLRGLPHDPLQVEALEVLLGEHPRAQSIAQFTAENGYCTRNHAYRRIKELRARLQDKLMNIQL
jgi:hypothetical protein